jgi:hypothetical protein
MPVYRAYQMDKLGRFKSVNLFACKNDADALRQCAPLAETGRMLLWDRMRFVAQVERPGGENRGEAA